MLYIPLPLIHDDAHRQDTLDRLLRRKAETILTTTPKQRLLAIGERMLIRAHIRKTRHMERELLLQDHRIGRYGKHGQGYRLLYIATIVTQSDRYIAAVERIAIHIGKLLRLRPYRRLGVVHRNATISTTAASKHRHKQACTQITQQTKHTLLAL